MPLRVACCMPDSANVKRHHMPISLETRKPIDELRPEDLAAFPIWEFASDEEENEEQDETWVRPVSAKAIGPDLYSLSVAADFHTASGQVLGGFVGVTTAEEFECSHGVLLHAGNYLFIPSGEFEVAERSAFANALGMETAQVFPLRFSLKVLVQGESTARAGEFQ